MNVKQTIDAWREVIDGVNEQTLEQRQDVSLREENARLRKALEYYADDIHYDPYFFGDATCDVTEDGGHIAREALSNGEESNAL